MVLYVDIYIRDVNTRFLQTEILLLETSLNLVFGFTGLGRNLNFKLC